MFSAVKGWFTWLIGKPFVKHIIRAVDRFANRLGWQFAAAITYFSFLAVVPILMVSFSIAGFVLTSQPGLLKSLQSGITSLLPGTLESSVSSLLDQAINARFTVGVIGLVVALYSGVSWMGNLRSAIQAMWRPDFGTEQEIAAESLGRYYLKSLRYLAALTVGIALSLALTAVGTSAQKAVLGWLGLDRISWLGPVFTVVPIALAILADMAIFLGVYRVLPPKGYPAKRKALIRGSAAAAIAFEVLKFALTLLLPLLLRSTTAKIFGPIIGLLIFFNLAATVVLFLAAWIATSKGSIAGADLPVPVLPEEQDLTEIRLSRPGAQGLDRIAQARGVSREAVIQTAIEEFLADPD
ncbi:inner membrane protein YhjD [Nakamurella sp. PAMC28650]|uniref:inner membrane protein YhjD n=1 Tax=Nakamurella sp. PAMC28650 TaxID=2762325 RepID=UPI00164E746F|nr:inner membrane protein YhjD [Nakamurella sp. PAMC28650]QNK79944.1 inner membrane protein YhjD [Nakamurella sp. PAMC28650]